MNIRMCAFTCAAAMISSEGENVAINLEDEPDTTVLVPFAWITEAKLVLNDTLMARGAQARASRIEHEQSSESGED